MGWGDGSMDKALVTKAYRLEFTSPKPTQNGIDATGNPSTQKANWLARLASTG